MEPGFWWIKHPGARSAATAYNITAPSCPSQPSARDHCSIAYTSAAPIHSTECYFNPLMKVGSYHDSHLFLQAKCTVIFQLCPAGAEAAAHGPFYSGWQHLEKEVMSEVIAAGLLHNPGPIWRGWVIQTQIWITQRGSNSPAPRDQKRGRSSAS